MKKINNSGYMLIETLIVTTFVAGVLLFLFIQFTTIENAYDEYYNYNSPEKLYALEDVRNYIESDVLASDEIEKNINFTNYISYTTENSNDYLKKLMDLERIDILIVIANQSSYSELSIDQDFDKILSRIKNDGSEDYRLIAKFNDGTFATLRFNIY